MSQNELSILQVSPSDSGGGAELVAKHLFEGFQGRGLDSLLLVDRKTSCNAKVVEINNDRYRNAWFLFWQTLLVRYEGASFRIPGLGRGLRAFRAFGRIPQMWRHYNGIDEYDFPGSQRALSRLSASYNILHAHNLHGGYFDLRLLSELSQRKTVVLTLHDAWLFSGHCAFSLDCDRWQTGCGRCPDLSLFPAVNKDATDRNWLVKKTIFDGSKIYLITPSHWLMRQAKQSLLKDAIMDSKVIPNGVDTTVFYPRHNVNLRAELDIPKDAKVLMVAASGLKENQWKDFATLRQAIALLESRHQIIVLAVGGVGDDEVVGRAELKFIEFQNNQDRLAELYSISDIYIHSSIVEVFGNVMLEARACGTPVVSTCVGGVKEHLNSINWSKLPADVNYNESDFADGVLCLPANANDFAAAIQLLLDDEPLRSQLSENSVANMRKKFDISLQVDRTLNWYSKILDAENKDVSSGDLK